MHVDQPLNIDDPEALAEEMRRQALHAAEVYAQLQGQPFDDQLALLTRAFLDTWRDRIAALARAKAAATIRGLEIGAVFETGPDDHSHRIEFLHQAIYQPGLSVQE